MTSLSFVLLYMNYAICRVSSFLKLHMLGDCRAEQFQVSWDLLGIYTRFRGSSSITSIDNAVAAIFFAFNVIAVYCDLFPEITPIY